MKSSYIYSDESGVFDKHHHDIFVYGGIVCVGQDKASSLTREELKAYYLNNDDKRKLYRIIKDCYKFAVIIDLKKLMNVDFASPQAKQRFLDYAFKRGVKASLNAMNSSGAIDLDEELEMNLLGVEPRGISPTPRALLSENSIAIVCNPSLSLGF